uniref:Golgi apparatus membrane protein TVP23 homolog n=1 Tax=Schizaphis graminum TaxID=13262 RepID=A0A2S2NL77_SCHGA
MDPLSDDTIPFGEENTANSTKLPHPYVTFFHLFFRVSAVVIYFFGRLFTESFITLFVLIILLLSMDFWIVKNITGRIMVGLRWWNYVDDDGVSHWVYESRKHRVNSGEYRIFWAGLWSVTGMWILFFITSFFSINFKWMLLVCIALTLNIANLYGYIKCKGGNQENLGISSMASSFIFQNIGKVRETMSSLNNPPSSPPNIKPTGIV